MRLPFQKPANPTQDPLFQALTTWKNETQPNETLTREARGRILSGAFESLSESHAPAPLFSPVPRRIVAGTLPAVLALVVVAVFADRVGDPVRPASKLRVGKAGDEVVFTIANGGTPHRVYKSSLPNNFHGAELIVVEDGAFRDRVQNGSDLTFYRID
jgi:hypothetical protein